MAKELRIADATTRNARFIDGTASRTDVVDGTFARQCERGFWDKILFGYLEGLPSVNDAKALEFGFEKV